MFFWAGTDHCYHGIKTAHTSVHRTSVQISLNRFSRGIARKALPRLGGAVVWCYWWSRDLYKRVRKRAIVRNRESANEHAPQTGEGMPPMSQVASASPSWNKSSSLYPLTPLDRVSIAMFFPPFVFIGINLNKDATFWSHCLVEDHDCRFFKRVKHITIKIWV